MSLKDILVYLDDGQTNSDRVNAAFYLARAHDANITGVALASIKPMHAKVEADDAIERMGEKLADRLVADFNQAAELAGLKVNTIIIFGDARSSAVKMAHYARNFDLIMLRQPNPARDHFLRLQEFAQQVMLLSGRPIFFMPYIGAKRIPFEKALIAWDGTPAASRAVHDAIPLLARTKEVIILVVESSKQVRIKSEVLVEGLSAHLANHGINSQALRVNPGVKDVPSVILNQIADNDIDLLVMGGYGTPTLKQKVFGGVSLSLLSSMLVPVLMSH